MRDETAQADHAVEARRCTQGERDHSPHKVRDRDLDPGLFAQLRQMLQRALDIDGHFSVDDALARLVPARYRKLATSCVLLHAQSLADHRRSPPPRNRRLKAARSLRAGGDELDAPGV